MNVRQGKWVAVHLSNNQAYLVGDQLISPGGEEYRAKFEAQAKEYNDIGVGIPEGPYVPRGTVRGHPRGYWIIRWVEERENEYGPVSP